MDREALIHQLRQTFLEEFEMLLARADRDLLALERGVVEARRASALLRSFHSLKGAARAVALEPIEAACHHLEGFFAGLRDQRWRWTADTDAALGVAMDALRGACAQLAAGQELDPAALTLLLPQLEALATSGEPLTKAPAWPSTEARSTFSGVSEAERSIPVPAARLDALALRSAELQLAQHELHALAQTLASVHDELRQTSSGPGAAARLREAQRQDLQLRRLARRCERLLARFERLCRDHDRVTTRLDSELQRLRLVSFGHVCQGFERVVHDIATAQGKEVELQIQGGDLEFDRTVLASLRTPLLQLLRNAVSHGVESMEARRGAGKPPRGVVRVAAVLRGTDCEIVVEDDGRGIDVSAVRARAEALGVQAPEGDTDAARLIFHPGFSTADEVDVVAGRGVGLDIVRARVDALHGFVDLESTPGQGTRFRIVVPIHTSSIHVLLVRVQEHVLALPAAQIERVVRLRGDASAVQAEGGEVALPLHRLAGLLFESVEERAPSWAVIVVADATRLAFAVDAVDGLQQVLVKPLGPRLRGLRSFNGAALLPDASLVFILHTAELIRMTSGIPPRGLPRDVGAATPTVLLVDDTATTLFSTRAVLVEAGFRVLEAHDAEDALARLFNEPVDIVVSDVEMPGMSGYDLTAAVRRDRNLSQLRVVLFTGLNSPLERRRGQSAGADAFIVRNPEGYITLVETLRHLLAAAPLPSTQA